MKHPDEENGDLSNSTRTMALTLVGVFMTIILVIVGSGNLSEEHGFEVLKSPAGYPRDGQTTMITIESDGKTTIDGQLVEEYQIITMVQHKLQEVDPTQTLYVVIRPNGKCSMEDFARVHGLVKSINSDRLRRERCLNTVFG